MLRSDARGAWTGLGLAADRTALLQAAVEGVAFALRHALEALPGLRPVQLRPAGGAPSTRASGRCWPTCSGRTCGRSRCAAPPRSAPPLLAAEAASLPRPAVPLGTGEPVGPSARSAAYEEAFDRYRQQADQLPAGASVEPTVTSAPSA